jgi:hypothetical protein
MDMTAFEIIREEILKAFSLYRIPKTDYRNFIMFVHSELEKNPNVDHAKLEDYLQRLKWSVGGLNFFLASWITQFKKAMILQAAVNPAK